MSKEIPLSKGKFAIVDDCDFDHLMQWKWSYIGRYAVRMTEAPKCHITGKRKREVYRMHRVIMNTPDDLQTDHINGNKLDNRRENLRICTNQQNSINKPPKRKYKGVRKVLTCINRWQTEIAVNGKQIHVGIYGSEEEAAIAYNKAAKKYFGEFAWLNKISIAST